MTDAHGSTDRHQFNFVQYKLLCLTDLIKLTLLMLETTKMQIMIFQFLWHKILFPSNSKDKCSQRMTVAVVLFLLWFISRVLLSAPANKWATMLCRDSSNLRSSCG